MTPLVQKIQAQIQDAGGWIGADAFMQAALYTPGLGYYTGGADPFGQPQAKAGSARGDFVTGPMLGPWLAQAIWDWSKPLRLAHPGQATAAPFRIREFGGGRGDLAAALLRLAQASQACADASAGPIAIEMVELSADLQARQQAATRDLGNVVWTSSLTLGFSGLVLANEVIDAMPVRCFEWAGGDQVLEWGVGLSGEGNLVWQSRPADAELQAVVIDRQRAAAARGLPWDQGYRGEVCPWLAPWCRSLFESMDRGAVLLIDYGYAQPELDHPGRTRGTLCAHYQHRRFDEPRYLLDRIGQQDLTAHVDFSALARAATQAGFEVGGFVTQARFLMNTGLLESAQRLLHETQDMVLRTKLLQSLQVLLSESEMGEVFKVMLLTKNLPADLAEQLHATGFALGDRHTSL